MNNIQCRAILAQRLLTARGIMTMALLSADTESGQLSVTGFDHETPGTSFAPAVALIKAEALDEFLMDDLEMMVRNCIPVERIDDYLSSSSLLADTGAPLRDTAVLSLSSPLAIILLQ